MNEWEKKDIRFFRFWDSLISHCTVTLTEQNRQDYIRKFHINPKKIRSIYNWIKPEILTMRKKYKADSRKIITVGRFSEEKGYDLLVEVAKKYCILILSGNGIYTGREILLTRYTKRW